MRYFSGFCFKNEGKFWDDFLIQSDFNVAGFSYGAIKAFEYAFTSKSRIDTLQLISPAFFNDKDRAFKKLQLISFRKDAKIYCDNFLKNVKGDATVDINAFFTQGSSQELEELLHYEWKENALKILSEKGIKIEIYLGGKDKIINAQKVAQFFRSYATIYIKKNAGHILR